MKEEKLKVRWSVKVNTYLVVCMQVLVVEYVRQIGIKVRGEENRTFEQLQRKGSLQKCIQKDGQR